MARAAAAIPLLDRLTGVRLSLDHVDLAGGISYAQQYHAEGTKLLPVSKPVTSCLQGPSAHGRVSSPVRLFARAKAVRVGGTMSHQPVAKIEIVPISRGLVGQQRAA